MRIYDRKLQKYIEEKEYQEGILRFLYHTVLGRVLLKVLVARPWLSKAVAIYYKSRLSKKKIIPFIEENNVDVSEWVIEDFKTFNDFFIRRKDVSVDSGLISIADSKLSVYKIDEGLKLKIKNSIYNLEDILGSSEMAEKYNNGTCLVFRLGVNDYHRYIYIDSGKLISQKFINGELHTVRSISEKYNVFSRNCRVVNEFQTESLGDVAQVEVGALLVGCVQNYNKSVFIKGEEKGYFEYGGSTVVVLLQEGVVTIDADIIEQSNKDIEVKVSVGEQIGICN